ncbi:hypothetical protein [Kitasatospora sp. NPDC097643]|uniref:hypothetical protein n=1 Tax=Kitasatospora sp. NPDC097643 TaxID=3157230 RepID=UPI0033271778
MTIVEDEPLETYALPGLQLDLTFGDPVLFDLGQAAWTVPKGWTKERVSQPHYGFRLLDEHGVAMIEGVLDVRPEVGKVAMALTEEGWQTVRERWVQLSFWDAGRSTAAEGPGRAWT